MKGWDGSVAEISVFPTEISATGLKIFLYEHSIPVAGTKRFWQNSFAFATERTKWRNFALYVILIRKYANYLCYSNYRSRQSYDSRERYNVTCANLFLFFEFYLSLQGWNISYERKTKFIPVTESARSIQPGPYEEALNVQIKLWSI